MKSFEKEIEIRWSDCDPNMHVRHSAYYEYGAHIRIKFFEACGYFAHTMSEMNIGPILFKEECNFIREIRPDETIRINLLKGDVSDDASRWTLHHELFNKNDEKTSQITVRGAWMNLSERRLTAPPNDLAQKFHALSEGKNYTYKKS